MTDQISTTVDDQIAILANLEARARRFETPCEDGVIVWHSWGEGPPLMLIHGSHGSWSHWVRNIDALARHYTLWVPDVPGYGDSAMPGHMDHDAITQPLARGLVELVGDNLPIDVIGFSFGGVVAAYLAAHFPGAVRRVILVGAGGLDIPLTGSFSLKQIRGLEGEELLDATRHNLLAIMLHDPASVDELALHVQTTNRDRGRLRPDGFIMPDRLLEVIPQLGHQVDAIWGEHDAPHPYETHEPALREHFPGLEFVMIPGGGHWVAYERAEDFNREALAMLAKPLR